MSTHAAQPKILIAEDEEDVLNLIASNLKSAGFAVIKAGDGPAALEKVRTQTPALLVLDLMLPGMSGLEVCKVLKSDAATARLPILMLTAKAEEVDRILGLELGADDYLTKPFSPRELVLRVRSILRRIEDQAEPANQLKLGDIVIDRAAYKVLVKGRQIEFTATEFKLLTVLVERRGRVQSRDTLLNDVWGYESAIDTRTVDTHVRRLRDKLGIAASHLETVRGFGYKISDRPLRGR